MKIETGTFTGNGAVNAVTIGWRPQMVIARTATSAGSMHYHCEELWCRRTNGFHDLAASQSGIQITDDGFKVGGLVGVNESGATIYWMAIAPSVEDSNGFSVTDYMGSGTNGRVLVLPRPDTRPMAAIFKRDSNAAGIFWEGVTGMATRMDSTSQASATAYVTSAAPGQFVLTSDIRVNEYNTGNGEGTNCIAFYPDGTNLKMVQWTGNGQANRTISTGDNRRIKAIFAQVADGTGGPRLKTMEMPAGVIATAKPVALPADNIVITGSDFVLTVSSGMNTSARLYTALVFFEESETPISHSAPAVITSGRKAVFLPGRTVASRIECGASDATLSIQGSITLEWMGQAPYGAGGDTTVGTDLPLIARSIGPTGPAATPDTRGNFSFALALVRNQGTSAQGWSGPQMMTTVSSFLDLQLNPVHCGYLWRTGVMPRVGNPFDHWVYTVSGTGLAGAAQVCRLYRNGVMVKQRDMAVPSGVVGITAGVGHTTCIGSRWDGTNFVSPGRMTFMLARVYSVALTAQQARLRYERAALQSSVADITTGLAEEWDASNARGTLLPATVNAANNGTIVGGSLLTL